MCLALDAAGACLRSRGPAATMCSLEMATESIATWGLLWGIEDFNSRVRIGISSRMRRSLARCVPARGEIRVSASLLTGEPLLLEVLCHEAAHIAVHLLHGPACRPHGSEWRRLMTAAGYEPHARLEIKDEIATPPPPPGQTYEHRCPVCQTVYRARRPMQYWRCSDCVAAGLDGRLEISRGGR
jgi:predicted SprT family Zn-dependent metalloprotease